MGRRPKNSPPVPRQRTQQPKLAKQPKAATKPKRQLNRQISDAKLELGDESQDGSNWNLLHGNRFPWTNSSQDLNYEADGNTDLECDNNEAGRNFVYTKLPSPGVNHSHSQASENRLTEEEIFKKPEIPVKRRYKREAACMMAVHQTGVDNFSSVVDTIDSESTGLDFNTAFHCLGIQNSTSPPKVKVCSPPMKFCDDKSVAKKTGTLMDFGLVPDRIIGTRTNLRNPEDVHFEILYCGTDDTEFVSGDLIKARAPSVLLKFYISQKEFSAFSPILRRSEKFEQETLKGSGDETPGSINNCNSVESAKMDGNNNGYYSGYFDDEADDLQPPASVEGEVLTLRRLLADESDSDSDIEDLNHNMAANYNSDAVDDKIGLISRLSKVHEQSVSTGEGIFGNCGERKGYEEGLAEFGLAPFWTTESSLDHNSGDYPMSCADRSARKAVAVRT